MTYNVPIFSFDGSQCLKLVRRIFGLMLIISLFLPGKVVGQSFWEEVQVALSPVLGEQGNGYDMRLKESDGYPIKCLTPHFMYATISNPDAHESEAIRSMFKAVSETEVQNAQFYVSPSGNFEFEYTVTGASAVSLVDESGSGIPDYVERAALYADESYEYLVTDLGFTDFLIPGPPYRFRILNISGYGYTQSQGSTTFIVIRNSYVGFPANDDPEGNAIGALKVTIAHEIKHAIQFAAGRWRGDTGAIHWAEVDATKTEEIVYDEVNDYYNYINSSNSIFRNPNGPTPVKYSHATFSLYYAEKVGIDFWVDVWDDISLDPAGTLMASVMSDNLVARGKTYAEEFTRNHLWHFASGSNAVAGYGFKEAFAYPTPQRTFRFATIDSLRSLPEISRERAAQYIILDELSSLTGEVALNVSFSGESVGVGLLAYHADGSIKEYIQTGNAAQSNGILRINAPFRWEDTFQLGMIFANPSASSQEIEYTLSARELPPQVTLMPNFPNPFTSQTTIPFSLPRDSYVLLEVYDVLGRRVDRLIDENLSRGFYDIPFQSRGLASGVYVYHLRVGLDSHVGKMTLLK